MWLDNDDIQFQVVGEFDNDDNPYIQFKFYQIDKLEDDIENIEQEIPIVKCEPNDRIPDY